MTDVAALMKRYLVEIEPEDINSELRYARHSGRQHAEPLVKRDSPHSSTMERRRLSLLVIS